MQGTDEHRNESYLLGYDERGAESVTKQMRFLMDFSRTVIFF